MRTTASNLKIRQIINLVKEEKLQPRPEFQRRLVWTPKDKDLFLDTVIRGYPFPEIYLADGKVDLDEGTGTQLLVDGLQRVSTLIEFFDGSPHLKLSTVTPYKNLAEEQRREFLQYDVAVRDLGTISKDELVEVFRRINATKYNLLDIEVNNAVYNGEFIKYATSISEKPFFIENGVFTRGDFKRMGDLRFSILIISTMISGYFNRDDAFEDILSRFNDAFELRDRIDKRISDVFDFIEECGFFKKSRVWKKADLFSLIVELDILFREGLFAPEPLEVVSRIEQFYLRVDGASPENRDIPSIYYKASLQATNDRLNRIRRGLIVAGVLRGEKDAKILSRLKERGLVDQ